MSNSTNWPTTSRQERGYGANWERIRKRILERDKHLCQCQHCKAAGLLTLATEVDHIKPKAKGGTDHDSNLQSISSECHKRKTKEDQGKQITHPARRIGLDGFPLKAGG